MSIVRHRIVAGQKPTDDQLAELERAKEMPIIFDEDSPELTEEFVGTLKRVEAPRGITRLQQPMLSFPVHQEIYDKVKGLGLGYAGILEKMMELVLNDQELLDRCK